MNFSKASPAAVQCHECHLCAWHIFQLCPPTEHSTVSIVPSKAMHRLLQVTAPVLDEIFVFVTFGPRGEAGQQHFESLTASLEFLGSCFLPRLCPRAQLSAASHVKECQSKLLCSGPKLNMQILYFP